MYRHFPSIAPLRRIITIEDIGETAVWLSSDMARSVTGVVLFVDSGFNVLGVPTITDQV